MHAGQPVQIRQETGGQVGIDGAGIAGGRTRMEMIVPGGGIDKLRIGVEPAAVLSRSRTELLITAAAGGGGIGFLRNPAEIPPGAAAATGREPEVVPEDLTGVAADQLQEGRQHIRPGMNDVIFKHIA